MSKSNGLGQKLYVGGYNLSGDIGSLDSIHGGPVALEVTGIDKYAPERIGGLRDGGLDFTAFYNTAADRAHARLSPLSTVDQTVTVVTAPTIGAPAATIVALQQGYDGDRAANGMFTFKSQFLGDGYGLEWGRTVTAGERTDTAATNGASFDFGSVSPGAFGLQAWLQVLAFTGTDATIKLQGSSDDGVGDAYADIAGGGFVAVTTAPGAQRIATAAINVERYIRAVTTTSAGFTLLTFVVAVTRNPVAVSF